MVLERSHYPDGFPQLFRLAYIPESHQLVVQYSLPTFDRVPAVAEYRYVKTGDKVTEKTTAAERATGSLQADCSRIDCPYAARNL
jgi:restriction system protein